MAHIVMSTCIRDMLCVQACTVDAFYDAGSQLVINPDDCIDCGNCISECPVEAIVPEEEVPENEQGSIAKNRDFFEDKSPEELEAVHQKASE